jgi:hypothetical protein
MNALKEPSVLASLAFLAVAFGYGIVVLALANRDRRGR